MTYNKGGGYIRRQAWIIYRNDIAEGQAFSWHKALDVLQCQTGVITFRVYIISKDYIRIETDTNLVYAIRKELLK